MSECMDNFHFDINGHSDKALRAALALVMESSGNHVVGYSEKGPQLTLYWSESERMTPLPRLDPEGAFHFVKAWLRGATYEDEPDHDGSNTKGWRMFNEDWGHVGGDHYAFVAIVPDWAMHGK